MQLNLMELNASKGVTEITAFEVVTVERVGLQPAEGIPEKLRPIRVSPTLGSAEKAPLNETV